MRSRVQQNTPLLNAQLSNVPIIEVLKNFKKFWLVDTEKCKYSRMNNSEFVEILKSYIIWYKISYQWKLMDSLAYVY